MYGLFDISYEESSSRGRTLYSSSLRWWKELRAVRSSFCVVARSPLQTMGTACVSRRLETDSLLAIKTLKLLLLFLIYLLLTVLYYFDYRVMTIINRSSTSNCRFYFHFYGCARPTIRLEKSFKKKINVTLVRYVDELMSIYWIIGEHISR